VSDELEVNDEVGPFRGEIVGYEICTELGSRVWGGLIGESDPSLVLRFVSTDGKVSFLRISVLAAAAVCQITQQLLEDRKSG
jgi:hypothetical protein